MFTAVSSSIMNNQRRNNPNAWQQRRCGERSGSFLSTAGDSQPVFGDPGDVMENAWLGSQEI